MQVEANVVAQSLRGPIMLGAAVLPLSPQPRFCHEAWVKRSTDPSTDPCERCRQSLKQSFNKKTEI